MGVRVRFCLEDVRVDCDSVPKARSYCAASFFGHSWPQGVHDAVHYAQFRPRVLQLAECVVHEEMHEARVPMRRSAGFTCGPSNASEVKIPRFLRIRQLTLMLWWPPKWRAKLPDWANMPSRTQGARDFLSWRTPLPDHQ